VRSISVRKRSFTGFAIGAYGVVSFDVVRTGSGEDYGEVELSVV
jgi:hypothetical protein